MHAEHPVGAGLLDDPYPLYRTFRDEHPVFCDTSLGQPVWLLFRYDDVSEALGDWRTYSSVQGPGTSAFGLRNREGGTQMIESDPPLHERLRDTVRLRYSPRRVRELEHAFRQAASELLDQLSGRDTVDVASAFAWPLTLQVTGEMIGIPAADREMVLRWYLDVVYSGSPQAASAAAVSYGEYFSHLATERRARPLDDLISDLMQLSASGAIDRADAVMLCMDLFEGGVDVPANLIGNSVVALADRPEQRRELGDPRLDEGALRLAVEELARFDTPIQYLPRVTTRDVTLHGSTIPQGSRVRLVLAAANRDERHYDHPDLLDLSRPPHRSVAFGVGAHFCIGAPLARLGVGIVLPMLLRALPDYRLAGAVVERPRGADIMRALLTLRVETATR